MSGIIVGWVCDPPIIGAHGSIRFAATITFVFQLSATITNSSQPGIVKEMHPLISATRQEHPENHRPISMSAQRCDQTIDATMR